MLNKSHVKTSLDDSEIWIFLLQKCPWWWSCSGRLLIVIKRVFFLSGWFQFTTGRFSPYRGGCTWQRDNTHEKQWNDLGGTNIQRLYHSMRDGYIPSTKLEKPLVESKWDMAIKNVKDRLYWASRSWFPTSIKIGLSAPGLANETNTCINFLPNRLLG